MRACALVQVLENYHAARLFDICSSSDMDVLRSFPSGHYGDLRKLIIEQVLCTDVARHTLQLQQLEESLRVAASTESGAWACFEHGWAPMRCSRAIHTPCSRERDCACCECWRVCAYACYGDSHWGVKPFDEHLRAVGALMVPQRRMVLRLSMMCSDVSHYVRPIELHLRWVGRLADEFGAQVRTATAVGSHDGCLRTSDVPYA